MIAIGRAKMAGAVAAILLVAACGSTVKEAAVEQGGSVPGVEGEEFGLPLDDAAEGTSPLPTASASGAAPTVGSGARAPGSTPGGGGQAARPATGRIPAGAGARGVTDKAIRVGMVDIDLSVAAKAIGAIGGSANYNERTRPMGEAVASYINERGGIAGRKLEVVWHKSNAADLATEEGRRRDAQRACATWTEDNQVFAFLDRNFVSEVFFECARRGNAVMMPYYNGLAVDEQSFRELNPLWYSVTRLIAERRDRNLVESLVRRGVLTRSAKVGIMVEDWVGARRGVSNGMEPALAAHGIEVVAKAVYPDAIESPWDTYILQFRNAGVTHVLAGQPWDGLGFPGLFMMRAAENQGWRPVWGVGSDNQPFRIARAGGPRPQLERTFAMGWQPANDVGQYEKTNARARCVEVAQQPIGNDSDEYWLTYCEMLFLFQAVLERATEVSPAGMKTALGVLGGNYESISAIGGRTRFSPDRHDGVAVQGDLVYDGRCQSDGTSCFRYAATAPMP